HVILGFHSDESSTSEPDAVTLSGYRERQEITLELATEFLRLHKRNKLGFRPLGVAQGWSTKSYAQSVQRLQKMGYRYIAVGGLVPLKTDEIVACLQRIDQVRKRDTKLHLLGVNRCEHLKGFGKFGVVSFDSTSPLLRAFKDDRHNYYTRSYQYS